MAPRCSPLENRVHGLGRCLLDNRRLGMLIQIERYMRAGMAEDGANDLGRDSFRHKECRGCMPKLMKGNARKTSAL
jgi:hypothetical protein